MPELRIGNRAISYDKAKKRIIEYTSEPANPKKPYAYPWYDTYDTGTSNELCDADFLAPVLLNAPPTIAAYATMKRLEDALNTALEAIPPGSVLDNDADVSLIGPLYACLADKNTSNTSYGVSGTTLSKVLHRKRPDFIPLYDEHIRRCYRKRHGDEAPRIPDSKDRTWSDFMILLADEIRSDVLSHTSSWDTLNEEVPKNAPLTRLRCFDIVAWRVGGSR